MYPNAVSGFVQELLSAPRKPEELPINKRISNICYWIPRVNRLAGPGVVAIMQGYRYLEHVENRWLSTGEEGGGIYQLSVP